jgi:hypothetical protein
MQMAKWSAISSTGTITGQPHSKHGQEKFDHDDNFFKIDISYSTELMTASWTLVQRFFAGTTHIVPFCIKSDGRRHSIFAQGHCSCSISSAMLEAGIRISTFSAIPADPVTHMNQNIFGYTRILICRTHV